MGPRTCHFDLRQVFHRFVDFANHGGDQLAHFILAGTSVNAEHAAIHVGRREGIDRVAKTPFLTHFLEQPRRHPAAQQSRIDLCCVIVGVVIGDAVKACDEMDLLQIAHLAKITALIGCDLVQLRSFGRKVTEMLFGQRDQRVVINPARRRQHNAACVVLVAHVTAQIVAMKPTDAIGRPQDCAPDRLVGISRFLKVVEDDVVRRVVGLANFLDHHRLLALQLFGIEHRVLQQVTNDIHRKGHVIF